MAGLACGSCKYCCKAACIAEAASLDGASALATASSERMVWAYSSVVEHYVDIVGVASSILATPTIRAAEVERS